MEISHMTPIPHICITFPIIIATHHERATFAAINEPTLINIIITKVHKVYIWIHSLKKKILFIFDCIGSSMQRVGTPLHCSARDSIAMSSLIVMSQALGPWASVVVTHGPRYSMSLRSSLTRNQTCVPCISRKILNPWPTREVP